MTIVAPRAVNVLGGGGAGSLSTIFRDSFNRTPAATLGANWACGSKLVFPFFTGSFVSTATNIGAMTSVCSGNGLKFDHSAPTFNPVGGSLPYWAIALPTANSLISGLTQFASVRLCSTARAGSGNLECGPAVFVDLGVEFFGSGYFFDVQASNHAWTLQKAASNTFTTLASGVGIVDGDVMSIQATVGVGSITLTCFQNTTLLTTQVDGSPLTIGYPGMFGFASAQNTGSVRSEWQNWIGGLGSIQAF